MARSIDLDELNEDPARLAVETVQNLDPQAIARTEALGKTLDLSPAVPAVRRIVDFFRQIPLAEIDKLPENWRNTIQRQATEVAEIYKNMMSFNPANVANAAGERESLINQAVGAYGTVFDQLFQLVAYLSSQNKDVALIEREARATVDAALRNVAQTTETLSQSSDEAQRILSEVRRTAAEYGVSHEASFFGDQAAKHAGSAATWQTRTYWTAAALGGFALLTWAIGFWIEPKTAYQAVQFALSKVLIFSTIAFLLYLSSRTLMAHRHNEVVNRHRQNALLTFNALADAATTEQTREVVLTHASACIYAPQDSGFSKPGVVQTPPSLIDIAPRIMGAAQPGIG